MNDSLQVPPSSQQELQDFLSHALQPLTARNSSATQPPQTSGLKPLTYEEVDAFAQKLLQRQDDEAEKPRVGQLGQMFADADEQGLWEEYVDLFMPQWRGELRFEEEEDGVIEAMRENGDGGM